MGHCLIKAGLLWMCTLACTHLLLSVTALSVMKRICKGYRDLQNSAHEQRWPLYNGWQKLPLMLWKTSAAFSNILALPVALWWLPWGSLVDSSDGRKRIPSVPWVLPYLTSLIPQFRSSLSANSKNLRILRTDCIYRNTWKMWAKELIVWNSIPQR